MLQSFQYIYYYIGFPHDKAVHVEVVNLLMLVDCHVTISIPGKASSQAR